MPADSNPPRLGRYEIQERLGEGAMGVVYRARDPEIGRDVAIKVLAGRTAVDDEGDEESERERERGRRFRQEVRSIGSLSHPHIVTVHDIGRDEGRSFLVMEYVPGGSLQDRIDAGERLPPRRIARIVGQVAEALDAAHRREIVHRDVKPSNVLLDGERDAKVSDFGMARLADSRETGSGAVLGTPAYMAPEQASGRPAIPASDQFALGVVAYELLTGRRPFEAESPPAVLYRIVHEDPVPPSSLTPELPGEVDDVVGRALSRDPRARFPSCSDFAEALAGVLLAEGRPAAVEAAGDGEESGGWLDGDAAPKTPSTAGEAGGATASGVPQAVGRGWRRLRRQVRQRPEWAAGLAVAMLVAALAVWWAVPGSEGGVEPPASEDGAPVGTVPGTEPDPGDDRRPGKADGETGAAVGARDGQDERAGRETTEPRTEPRSSILYRITSLPSGAAVVLDGVPTGLRTPVELALRPGVEHRLVLGMEGYETLTFTFRLEDLGADQRRERRLHFPMVPRAPEPELPEDVRVVRAPSRVATPERVRHVDPVYPKRLRDTGVEGFVVLALEIGPRGRVLRTEVLRGLHPVLDRAAQDAAREWRYRPVEVDGEPVRVRFNVTVFFPPR